MRFVYEFVRSLADLWEPPTLAERIQREIEQGRLRLLDERKARDYHAAMVDYEELRMRTMKAELAREMKAGGWE